MKDEGPVVGFDPLGEQTAFRSALQASSVSTLTAAQDLVSKRRTKSVKDRLRVAGWEERERGDWGRPILCRFRGFAWFLPPLFVVQGVAADVKRDRVRALQVGRGNGGVWRDPVHKTAPFAAAAAASRVPGENRRRIQTQTGRASVARFLEAQRPLAPARERAGDASPAVRTRCAPGRRESAPPLARKASEEEQEEACTRKVTAASWPGRMERKVVSISFDDGRQLPAPVAASAPPGFAPDSAPTPSRFLAECGLLNVTPLATGYSEVNPFETSFAYPPADPASPPPRRSSSELVGREPSDAAKPQAQQGFRQQSSDRQENCHRRAAYVDPDDQFAGLRLLAEESVLTPPLPVFTKSKRPPVTSTANAIGAPFVIGTAVTPLISNAAPLLPPRQPSSEYVFRTTVSRSNLLPVGTGEDGTLWTAVSRAAPPASSASQFYVSPYTSAEVYPVMPAYPVNAGRSDASPSYLTYTQPVTVPQERPKKTRPLPSLLETANVAFASFPVSDPGSAAVDSPALAPQRAVAASALPAESSATEDAPFTLSASPPPAIPAAPLPPAPTRKRRTPPRSGEGARNPVNGPAAAQPASAVLAIPRKKGKATSESARKRKKSDELSSASEKEEPSFDEKRQKFLERNRMAASKCRQKKKEWAQELERRAAEVTGTNRKLHAMVAQLKEEVLRLKALLLAHGDCDCNIIQQYVQTSGLFNASGVSPGRPAPAPPADIHPNVPAATTTLSSSSSSSSSSPSSSSPSSSAPSSKQSGRAAVSNINGDTHAPNSSSQLGQIFNP